METVRVETRPISPSIKMDEECTFSPDSDINIFRRSFYKKYHEPSWGVSLLDDAGFDVEEEEDDEEDDYTEYCKVRKYRDLKLREDELEGYLTDRMIEVCSSHLKRSAKAGNFVLTNCNLQRKGLVNIDIIQFHQYLQNIDLSRNSLTTLEPLGCLHFLKRLNVSHNILTTLLDFKAPIFLSEVTYAHNAVTEIPNLCDFWSLVYLDLSHNAIRTIQGVDTLRYLQHLDLSYNEIEKLENLSYLNLIDLNLQHNLINQFQHTDLDGLHTIVGLETLNVSENKLTSFKFCENIMNVKTINASRNRVTDLVNLTYFRYSNYLCNLDCSENPVCEHKKYRDVLLVSINNLRILDGEVVDMVEKAEATFLYSNDPLKIVNLDYDNFNVIQNFLTPKVNEDLTINNDYAPMLVLVGAMGSKKMSLLMKAKEHPKHGKYFQIAVGYTTRPKYNTEQEGVQYHYLTHHEFFELIDTGAFFSSVIMFGHHYAYSYEELSKLNETKGVLIFRACLVTALQIKARFPNVYLVLAQPKNHKIHRLWLAQHFLMSQWVESYINYYVLQYMEKAYRTDAKNSMDDVLSFLDKYTEKDVEATLEEQEKVTVEPQTQTEDAHHIISEHTIPSTRDLSQIQSISGASVQLPSAINLTKRNTFAVASSILRTHKPLYMEIEKERVRFVDEIQDAAQDIGKIDSIHTPSLIASSRITKKSVSSSQSSTLSTTILSTISNISEPHHNTLCDTDSMNSCGLDSMDQSASMHKRVVEETKRCMDIFVDQQMQEREFCERLHSEKPGLFFTTLATDDEEQAVDALGSLVEHVIKSRNRKFRQSSKKPVECFDMCQDRVRMLRDLLK